jgi:hypothetical protein
MHLTAPVWASLLHCYSIFYASIITLDGDNEEASTCNETLLQALDAK